MDRIRKDFTTITLVMIPVAIAINIAIGQLVIVSGLPIYLDSIGTVLVGVLAGPWAGLLTGALSNIVWGVINPAYIPYFPVAAAIGLLAGLFAQAGWFRAWWRALIAGLITGVVAAILSAPITAFYYGGVTGTGTDAVVAFLRSTGASILEASFGQGIVSDPIDKTVTFLVVYVVLLLLPYRFKDRFPRAEAIE